MQLFLKLFSRIGKSKISHLTNSYTIVNCLSQGRVKVTIIHSFATMENTHLLDPPSAKGMKVLDKSAFNKTIMVSFIIVNNENMESVQRLLKKYYLKVPKVKPVVEEENEKLKILLNPTIIKCWDDFDENVKSGLEKMNISKQNFSKTNLDLGYKNWTAPSLIKAIIPDDIDPLTSFSMVGHIIHLNIKEKLLEYKNVIAEILLDKIPCAKTVICKKSIIDNVYRNFEMELLCGEPNFVASVMEHKLKFEFDFSKVYWNPRLSTEHFRIVSLLKPGDVLFDVFAGVGPFALPAAHKKCKVFANDLNPESFKWLNHNITLNSKCKDYIQTFNKDGADFILTDVKENLIKIWEDESFCGEIHCVMNLPAMAPTFIKHFKNLITNNDFADVERISEHLPSIHCYFFVREDKSKAEEFKQNSGLDLSIIEHQFVQIRAVSTAKLMYRITFKMPLNYLVGFDENEIKEPLAKKPCLS